MKTFTLTLDISRPNTQKLAVPAGVGFGLRLALVKNGAPYTPELGAADVIPVEAGYTARADYKIESGTTKMNWHNVPDPDIEAAGWLLDCFEPGKFQIDGNILEIPFKALSGKKNIAILVNASGTSHSELPLPNEWETVDSSTAQPAQYAALGLQIETVASPVNDPAVGGILLEGTYEDGTEFSFSVTGVENEAEEEEVET